MLDKRKSRTVKYSGKTLSIYETLEVCVNYSFTFFIIVDLYNDGSATVADYDEEADIYDYNHMRYICKEDLERYCFESYMGR